MTGFDNFFVVFSSLKPRPVKNVWMVISFVVLLLFHLNVFHFTLFHKNIIKQFIFHKILRSHLTISVWKLINNTLPLLYSSCHQKSSETFSKEYFSTAFFYFRVQWFGWNSFVLSESSRKQFSIVFAYRSIFIVRLASCQVTTIDNLS